jgi:hypothetical protein
MLICPGFTRRTTSIEIIVNFMIRWYKNYSGRKGNSSQKDI